MTYRQKIRNITESNQTDSITIIKDKTYDHIY